MSKNYINFVLPFLEAMSEKEKEAAILAILSMVLFLSCVVAVFSILPEHCSLFSSNIENGFACDGIDWRNPIPCGATCRDKGMAATASIIAGFGFGFFFVPFVFFVLRILLNRPVKQTKLFE